MFGKNVICWRRRRRRRRRRCSGSIEIKTNHYERVPFL